MIQKLLYFTLCMVLSVVPMADAATKSTKAKGQSVIQNGTKVRERVTAEGLYEQECYDAYYGCMDQFCIMDNSNGGTCACSDQNAKLESEFKLIQNTMEEAERIATVEVEKIKAGSKADIIFNGTRRYDKDGNVVGVDEEPEQTAEEARQAWDETVASLWSTPADDEDEEDGLDALELIAGKNGSELFDAAEKVCIARVPDMCEKDVPFLRQLYSRQILADCKAFENENKSAKTKAMKAMAQAESDVVAARKEMFDSVNKYDLGECMVEFKKCMVGEDACGADWTNCVSSIAELNMQNGLVTDDKTYIDSTKELAKKFDITVSTMEIIDSKRDICERVLDQCMAVRDKVWEKFLREAAPTIKVAEQKAESKMRQSCLTDISDCIQTACKDDIVGKGKDTMDACLARPDMVKSFCKLEVDKCTKMEPQIWDYVKDKLAAMRVDACTQEVKDCFTADTRCGPNFENCIGMDYEYIHDICPIDTLVVCKQANPKFSMDDLDSMLMGLYLNIDNSALDQCQELVDERMIELCGSTTDCNRFAADDVIGTGSLRAQKDKDVYRVTGMISFGSIKMGNASGTMIDNAKTGGVVLKPGEIGVQEYIEKVRERNTKFDAEGIISSIEEELNNIAGTINRTIEMIEQDPKIQFCVNGRDLSQIKKGGGKTAARFPNLLNDVKMTIAVSALRKAQENYNKKLTEEIAKATKDASADLAQYMCQKIAETGQSIGTVQPSTPLVEPFAISYDVGAGIRTDQLTNGGTGQFSTKTDNGSGVTKDVTSIFNRDSRTCHVCTTITTTSCTKKGGSLFHRSKNSCTSTTDGPNCEDIPM